MRARFIRTQTFQMSLSFLRGLLGGAARTTIAGLVLTASNYKVAIDFLRGRFGKLVVIERSHVNKLLNIALVFNERDMTGLHRLNNKIEIHHRGLKALEVNANTYKGIVVPAIPGKLPANHAGKQLHRMEDRGFVKRSA